MSRNRITHGRIAAVACSMLVMAALAACGAAGGSSSDTLKIGVLVEQTGVFSWYGKEAASGAQLYLRQHPSAGKRKIKFVTYDTGSAPEKAVTGFRKLVQQERVNAVVGLGLTNEAKVVAPLAKSLKTPLYVLSGSFTPPNDMTFGVPVQIGDMQSRTFEHFSRKGVKTFGLLTTNDATGQIADDLFSKLGARYHVQMVAHEHMNGDDVDVTPQLTNISAKRPDLIVAWVVGKPLGVVFNSAHQLNVRAPFLISYGNLAPGFLKSLSAIQPPAVYVQATKDVFWGDLPPADPQTARIRQFHTDYVKQFRQETGLGSASGYDAVMLLSQAVEKANSTKAADIVSALEKTNGVQGLFGTYHLSPGNHVGLSGTDSELGQVQNGTVKLLPQT